jgi:hypothetical protein
VAAKLETQTDANTSIVEDLVAALKIQLLSDPITRPAIIRWATLPDNSIEQEIERSLMLQEMLGGDFAGC